MEVFSHFEDIEATDDEDCCVVCLVLRPAITFIPCNHFVCCGECSRRLQRDCRPCPICRSEIEEVVVADRNVEDEIEVMEEIEDGDDNDNEEDPLLSNGENEVDCEKEEDSNDITAQHEDPEDDDVEDGNDEDGEIDPLLPHGKMEEEV
jgi:hypothetical protein